MTDVVAATDPTAVAAAAPPGGPTGAPSAVAAVAATGTDLLDTQTPAPVPSSTEGDAVVYEATGDVGLDLSLEFFGKLGLGLESAEMQEATKGNFQYLEAKLAAMGDKAKGYEQYLSLGKDAYTRIEAANKTAYENLQKSVHEAVGGPETWAAVQQFAKTTYQGDALKEVSATLNAGGLASVAMAQFLHRQALASKGTTVPGAAAVDTSSSPTATLADMSPLTKDQWRAEYRAGLSKHGRKFQSTAEYAALERRYPR